MHGDTAGRDDGSDFCRCGERVDKFPGTDWFSAFDFRHSAARGASFTFDEKPTDAKNVAADRADLTAVVDHPLVLSGGRSGVLEFEAVGLVTDGRQRP